MKTRKIILGFILILIMALAAACGSGSAGEESVPISSSDKAQTATLETIAELLGKSDLQATEMFGGGEENWTADQTFYIGRVYHVNLLGEEVSVYTSYDDKQLVNSVSIWLVNGEREVKEEDAIQWEERLNEFTGTKAVYHDTSSESGSKNWKWFLGDRAVTLNWMDDLLTIRMNVVVGELN